MWESEKGPTCQPSPLLYHSTHVSNSPKIHFLESGRKRRCPKQRMRLYLIIHVLRNLASSFILAALAQRGSRPHVVSYSDALSFRVPRLSGYRAAPHKTSPWPSDLLWRREHGYTIISLVEQPFDFSPATLRTAFPAWPSSFGASLFCIHHEIGLSSSLQLRIASSLLAIHSLQDCFYPLGMSMPY